MAQTINADDGVISGSAGLKSSSDGTAILSLQTKGTTALTVDGSQNVGIGVTPSAWGVSEYRGLQVGVGASLYGRTQSGDQDKAGISANAYWDTSWKYIATDSAARFELNGGQAIWFNAPSGTAGNTISFTQAMTLDASGNLGVGYTSPAYRLHLSSAIDTYAFCVRDTIGNDRLLIGSRASAPIDNITPVQIANDNDGNLLLSSRTNNASGIKFYSNAGTAAVERARIGSAGYAYFSSVGNYTGVGAFSGVNLSAQTYNSFLANVNDRAFVIMNSNAGATAGAITTQILTGASYHLQCYLDNSVTCSIAANGNITNTNGSYGTISDAKMKTDIVDAGSQWDDLKAVRFRKFKMKDDPSGLMQLGVVAQELEQTSPGLVDQHADRDADGNDLGTTTKSVKTSVLLMKAAVALQEAMARIEKLEAEMAALKGA